MFIELVEILSQVQTNQLHAVLQTSCFIALLAAVNFNCCFHAGSATWLLGWLDDLCAQPAAATLTAGQGFRPQHIAYPFFWAALYQVLEKCSLYTCDQVQRDNIRKTQPAMVDPSIGTSKGDSSAHFSVSQVDLRPGPLVTVLWVCLAHLLVMHHVCNPRHHCLQHVCSFEASVFSARGAMSVLGLSIVNCSLMPRVFADIQPWKPQVCPCHQPC